MFFHRGGKQKSILMTFFLQVGKLYIHYRLEVPDEDPIFESEDIICLLKDKKDLFIHKDHLSAKLDICRYSICSEMYCKDGRIHTEVSSILKLLILK